ncbi:MAG: flagellar hook-associated protein FlgK [Henriciella sp.]|nr:flagellar hook-associated protein FlgK [Henriciella sp.]
MSITAALLSARSGLTAVGARADIVATNVANASTPGYVRRSLTVNEILLGGETAGVQIGGVERSTNERLTVERQRLGSDLAQAEVLSSTWAALSQRVGDDIDNSMLFQHLTGLEEAFQNAVQSPESTTLANEVVLKANNLVDEFNNLSAVITQERQRADQDIKETVDRLNAALLKVEKLNESISGVDRTTSHAAALFDERGRVLDEISEYLPIQTFPRDSGTIDVLTAEGVYLLGGTAQTVEFTPTSTVAPGVTLANGNLSGLSVDGLDITPGAVTFGAVSSGSLAGLFALRDSDLPELEMQLDTMAQDLINRFSDPTLDPTNPVGSPGLFLDTNAAAGEGVAGRLQLNALVDPDRGGAVWRLRDGLGAVTQGPPGNNTILTNLSGAFSTVQSINVPGLQGGFTARDLVAQLGTLAGQKRIQNESVLTSVQVQFDAAQRVEAEKTGVDIETEMQDLIIIEQAYAANARVIEVVNQLIQELIEL